MVGAEPVGVQAEPPPQSRLAVPLEHDAVVAGFLSLQTGK